MSFQTKSQNQNEDSPPPYSTDNKKTQNQIEDSPPLPNDNKKSQNQYEVPPPPYPNSVQVTSELCAWLIKHSDFSDYNSEDEE